MPQSAWITRRWAAPVVIWSGLCWAVQPTLALENPKLFDGADLRLGVSMTPSERDDSDRYCQATLNRAASPPMQVDDTCRCFSREWESRTNRLHRLALPISEDHGSAQARRNLALIIRQEGGPREDRIAQLAREYEHAAIQAFKACGR